MKGRLQHWKLTKGSLSLKNISDTMVWRKTWEYAAFGMYKMGMGLFLLVCVFFSVMWGWVFSCYFVYLSVSWVCFCFLWRKLDGCFPFIIVNLVLRFWIKFCRFIQKKETWLQMVCLKTLEKSSSIELFHQVWAGITCATHPTSFFFSFFFFFEKTPHIFFIVKIW